MTKYYSVFVHEVLGNIVIRSNDKGVTALSIGEELVIENDEIKNQGWALTAKQQLEEYFKGERQTFNLPLCIEKGTLFQREVWNALSKIPYGSVWSYSDIAAEVQCPKAVRAVGGANRANPLPIIIPCHRVIGKDASLTGYAGNKIHQKELLLIVEGLTVQNGTVKI
ncbi:methylated-DNA--[protein]-cysteine S-methyltransferase [Priestia endophytica]|uniref:methylated-DNA--[protein]-cysteine S-methyltransferase n=1 Tax=Priestia endophytica TaxID=135735 RepID=UPI000DCA87E0|nr:methylated-DNA--[protein]-cysteine S-methyltransferase [Priestia endophytica]RAS81583.1 hypothetical protein A4R27_11080 [Priestia endophytica]